MNLTDDEFLTPCNIRLYVNGSQRAWGCAATGDWAVDVIKRVRKELNAMPEDEMLDGQVRIEINIKTKKVREL